MSTRRLNPLPEHMVGLELRLKLNAEWVKDELELKEDWEGGEYTYESIMATACELGMATLNVKKTIGTTDVTGKAGRRTVTEQESSVWIDIVRKRTKCDKRTLMRVVKRLKSLFTPTPDGSQITTKFYRLDDLLILGLGWPGRFLECDDTYSENAALSDAAEKYFGVTRGSIDPRKWERAKRDARQRLSQHLDREKRRADYRCMTQVGRSIKDYIHSLSGGNPENFRAGVAILEAVWAAESRESHHGGPESDCGMAQAITERLKQVTSEHGKACHPEELVGLVVKAAAAVKVFDSVVAMLPEWVEKVQAVGEELERTLSEGRPIERSSRRRLLHH